MVSNSLHSKKMESCETRRLSFALFLNNNISNEINEIIKSLNDEIKKEEEATQQLDTLSVASIEPVTSFMSMEKITPFIKEPSQTKLILL